jgi:hypothetical protein
MRWREPFNSPANEQIRFLDRGFLWFHAASNRAPLALTHGKVRR